MSNNIAIPDNALKDDLHINHADERATAINPVTGQTLEAEAQSGPDIPEMTEDEKLREAERLFVLFERYVLSLEIHFGLHHADWVSQTEKHRRRSNTKSSRGGPPIRKI